MVFGIFIVYKYAEIISNFGYFVNQAIPLSIDNLGENVLGRLFKENFVRK
jgi:hypothetical protein